VTPIWAPSTWFLGTRESTLQTASQSIQSFRTVHPNTWTHRQRDHATYVVLGRTHRRRLLRSIGFNCTNRNGPCGCGVWSADSRVPRNHVDGAQIGATWWIQLSDLCAAAIRINSNSRVQNSLLYFSITGNDCTITRHYIQHRSTSISRTFFYNKSSRLSLWNESEAVIIHQRHLGWKCIKWVSMSGLPGCSHRRPK